jgi:hypothetical protein
VGVSADVGVLQDVLRLALVADDAPCDPIQPSVVAPHQDLEELVLAPADPIDDVLVALGANRWGEREWAASHRGITLPILQEQDQTKR